MNRRSAFSIIEFIIGLILIALGIFSILSPQSTINTVMILFGIIAVILGVSDIVMAVRIERYTGFAPFISLISGALIVMSGIMLIVYPHAGTTAFLIIFPIWFIAHSISQLAKLKEIKYYSGRAVYCITLILSILGIALGILMIFRPMISMISASVIIGSYLIFSGINSIILSLSEIGKR